ncbi:MAG: phenylalanine--tRNA ligase subunit alpha [Patescibacteria group bacterium]
MREEIQSTKNEAIAQITEAKTASELENLRINYLGRNGKLSKLIREIKKLKEDEKKHVGKLANDAKDTIEKTIASQKNNLKEAVREWFDPTIPGKKLERGHLHLITQAIEEIASVFEKIGFTRMRYPEVEWDWFAFEGLNMPKMHPARDTLETFFVDQKPHPKLGSVVLTPHTSSGQIREMKRVKTPPIRMINIAKCYRRQSDVSHVPMFHQFEGLVIDKGIAITNLKGTLDYFARNYFGAARKTRLRPYHFQFTEPSFEVDITCDVCKGKARLLGGRGCRLCTEGWLELGGAGMVHPTVLKNAGIDTKKYTGFAFGWGVERVLMMKSGLSIPDLRILYSSDLRFLRQF